MLQPTKAPPRAAATLASGAYDRIEALLVRCDLRPGLHLSLQHLQEVTGLGRTPIHQAVSKLAADTLIIVQPRHGLQVAPIDLTRERMLLGLRRDMERFVVRLAAERANASHRNEILHMVAALRRGAVPDIDGFNLLDRRIDRLMVSASGEAFLESTLRPLHTMSRRIGWIYHSRVRPREGLGQTLECHSAILEAVAARDVTAAERACDRLISFCDRMFDVLGRGVDPTLFDCNLDHASDV